LPLRALLIRGITRSALTRHALIAEADEPIGHSFDVETHPRTSCATHAKSASRYRRRSRSDNSRVHCDTRRIHLEGAPSGRLRHASCLEHSPERNTTMEAKTITSKIEDAATIGKDLTAGHKPKGQ